MNYIFLSFGVPAKSGIDNDLIEAFDIGRKVVADFIDSLLGDDTSNQSGTKGRHVVFVTDTYIECISSSL